MRGVGYGAGYGRLVLFIFFFFLDYYPVLLLLLISAGWTENAADYHYIDGAIWVWGRVRVIRNSSIDDDDGIAWSRVVVLLHNPTPSEQITGN